MSLVTEGQGRGLVVAVGLVVSLAFGLVAQSPADPPVSYRVSFPEPEHRWLQVEASFPDLGPGAVVLQMSVASPGRYARHEFAKNVFAVDIRDGADRSPTVTRPRANQWLVTHHDGHVRVRYRIFGDRVDGTYLAVDSTHAHINMPATLMWVAGLEDRRVDLRFDPPPRRGWKAATQLFSTDDPWRFTAPNLQYLMDSPAELSDFDERTFTVPDPGSPATAATFRVVVHHDGDDRAVDVFAREVEQVVREAVGVFGEFPSFDGGRYTFLADYLPYASGDAMEHRNSTVLTVPLRFGPRYSRPRLIGAAAHEVVHAWNAERIRPASLEPFDFTDANVSGELWLVEGFTNYYGGLIPVRAGLVPVETLRARMEAVINTLLVSPGRRVHTPVEMSQLAPFTDAAAAIDQTNWGNTFVSYYTWGEAIALGLDLTLRARTDGQVTLDDFMRAMWTRFGRPGGVAPGLVSRPYTPAEVRTVLGDVAGDQRFADDFLARFIEGHELVDYAALLAEAGFLLRPRAPGHAWLGDVSWGPGLRVSDPTSYGSPLYNAGVDRDDLIESFDGQSVSTERELSQLVARKAPGDRVSIRFRRRGQLVDGQLTLAERAHVELVASESTGAPLTSQQQEFRDAWLGSTQRR